ncbi:nucleoside-diphosphate-sugar epimerase [Kitasatospora sp. GAS204A]|uniref:NAD-dependent epimerase/dehydratase family protein n=1 Tax=unclassified Kitasatospora TaxID=2633591 RepID=UPI002474720C|nr:NAD(P)-dependent oxidoreductase [Kitasatospora sp. GAS204B]MDH6119423.1 nucleoside-diphosphate-sugar epimerase [Kitasatospora sp. GAS204B]
MRILLLGADGFLGRHVATALRELPGAELATAGRRAAHDLRVDLTNCQVELLAVGLGRLAPELVVNCAGAVAGSARHQSEVNARGPAVLVEALELACPKARLIHLGSAGEYGPADPGSSLSERDLPRPTGIYGATKLAGTLAVAESALDAVSLRVFNPIGPGASAASLPGRLAAELAARPGGVVTVGDLSAYRDFVDARDVGAAVVAAALAAAPLPRILNVAGGRAQPVRAIAEGLAAAAGFTGRIEETGTGSDRSADVSWHQGDISAAELSLGWRPRIALDQSLRDLWSSVSTAASGPPNTASSAGPQAAGTR